MKKILSVMLIFALLVLVVGCKIQPLDEISSTSQTAEEKETDSIENEIAEIDDIDIDAELSELDNIEKDLELI